MENIGCYKKGSRVLGVLVNLFSYYEKYKDLGCGFIFLFVFCLRGICSYRLILGC